MNDLSEYEKCTKAFGIIMHEEKTIRIIMEQLSHNLSAKALTYLNAPEEAIREAKKELKQDRRQYNAERRSRRKALGQCVDCGEPSPDKTRCDDCRAVHNAKAVQYRLQHICP